jgi:RNA polymerase sigma factor (TIGR02999 family)
MNVSQITELIVAMGQGNSDAKAELMPLVYQELISIARSRMAHERADHTLQTTALVHEAYLRLLGKVDPQYDGRGHFFAAAAEAMRRILIEHARKKQCLKHGGAWGRVTWTDDLPEIHGPCDNLDELLSLDEALDRLAHQFPEEANLVKLLYFAGLNLEEAAKVMGTSDTASVSAFNGLPEALGRELRNLVARGEVTTKAKNDEKPTWCGGALLIAMR